VILNVVFGLIHVLFGVLHKFTRTYYLTWQ